MQDLGELAKEEAIHIGPGWIVVFGLLLLLNLYLAYHYLNIPHHTHKKFKSIACLVLHIGLTIATVWYFTQLFQGKTQSGFINILMVLAGIYLLMFAYCVTLFLITDLFRLINKIVKFPERVRNFGKNIYRNGLTIFVIAILLTVYGFWQPHHFVVKPYDLTLDARASQIEELNIVMISDAHVGASVRGNELAEIREKINALNPDVIVLDGDIFDEGTTDKLKEVTSEEFKKLKAKYGVYYTIGNHDDYMGGTAKQISYFDNSVVTPLIDETIKVADSFYLIGRADSPAKRASLTELTADVTQDLPVIVLDHRPTIKETSEDPLVQLQISGHTHDGQIYPGILTRPTAKSGKYGLHKVGTCELLVSCGVGTYAVPVRIGSTCEIVQLKINFE
jgi:predicted MPP superfamily phosphohydrolase